MTTKSLNKIIGANAGEPCQLAMRSQPPFRCRGSRRELAVAQLTTYEALILGSRDSHGFLCWLLGQTGWCNLSYIDCSATLHTNK